MNATAIVREQNQLCTRDLPRCLADRIPSYTRCGMEHLFAAGPGALRYVYWPGKNSVRHY